MTGANEKKRRTSQFGPQCLSSERKPPNPGLRPGSVEKSSASRHNPTSRLRSQTAPPRNSLEPCLFYVPQPEPPPATGVICPSAFTPSRAPILPSNLLRRPGCGIKPRSLFLTLGSRPLPAPSPHRRPRGSHSKSRHSSHPPTLLNLGPLCLFRDRPDFSPNRERYSGKDGFGRDLDPEVTFPGPSETRHPISRTSLSSPLLPRTQIKTRRAHTCSDPASRAPSTPSPKTGEGLGRKGGLYRLTWGGGARSWQRVEGSDAAPLREMREQRVLCFRGRHAHPLGPWLSPRLGWTLPAVSTPRWDPYHCYFRRLLRAPPCRSCRGTALSRLRIGATSASQAGNPTNGKRRARRGRSY